MSSAAPTTPTTIFAVFGATNTGKTFMAQCLMYLLVLCNPSLRVTILDAEETRHPRGNGLGSALSAALSTRKGRNSVPWDVIIVTSVRFKDVEDHQGIRQKNLPFTYVWINAEDTDDTRAALHKRFLTRGPHHPTHTEWSLSYDPNPNLPPGFDTMLSGHFEHSPPSLENRLKFNPLLSECTTLNQLLLMVTDSFPQLSRFQSNDSALQAAVDAAKAYEAALFYIPSSAALNAAVVHAKIRIAQIETTFARMASTTPPPPPLKAVRSRSTATIAAATIAQLLEAVDAAFAANATASVAAMAAATAAPSALATIAPVQAALAAAEAAVDEVTPKTAVATAAKIDKVISTVAEICATAAGVHNTAITTYSTAVKATADVKTAVSNAEGVMAGYIHRAVAAEADAAAQRSRAVAAEADAAAQRSRAVAAEADAAAQRSRAVAAEADAAAQRSRAVAAEADAAAQRSRAVAAEADAAAQRSRAEVLEAAIAAIAAEAERVRRSSWSFFFWRLFGGQA